MAALTCGVGGSTNSEAVDEINNSIKDVNLISELPTSDQTIIGSVNVLGYNTINDGGGGIFNYDASQSAVNNGGTIIDGWVRQYSGAINVKWFGAKGDGITDDKAALQAAADYLATTGGVINAQDMNILLASSVTITDGVILRGSLSYPTGWKADSIYSSTITVSGSVGINVREGATVEGFFINKAGVAYPQTQAQTAAWTGTAIEGYGQGIAIKNCLITGFDTGIHLGTPTNSAGRALLDTIFLDCLNCVFTENGIDVDRMNAVHCWPFMSNGVITYDDIERVGTGIHVKDNGTWARLENCFVFGYTIGFHIDDTTHTSMDNCATDYHIKNINPTPIGVLVDGDSANTTLDNCDLGGDNEIGLRVNITTAATSSVANVQVTGCRFTGSLSADHVHILDAGGVLLNSCVFRAGTNGIRIGSDSEIDIIVTGSRFEDVSTIIIDTGVGYTTNNIRWDADNIVIDAAVHWAQAHDLTTTVASIATLLVPTSSDFIKVTGSTTIANFNSSFPNRVVTLELVDGLSIGVAGAISTITGATTAYGAGDRATFICQGSVWYETSNTL